MSLGSLFVTSFALAFSGAMVPGPLLTVTIDEALRRGFSAGPLVAIGHALLELVLLIILVWGLNEIVVGPGLQNGIGLIGGLVLIWMAYGILKDIGKLKIDLFSPGDDPSGKNLGPVLKGITISILNPYFLVWWATIGLAYATIALAKGPMGLMVFYTGHILADFTWYAAVSFLIGTGRKYFNVTVYRIILTSCGVFLILLGAGFLYTAICYFAG